jgi:hypothetical protein
MVRLFVRINVADYETWREVYDQFYGERVAMGVMGDAAFQLVDDPNDVTVWHDFETPETVVAFEPQAQTGFRCDLPPCMSEVGDQITHPLAK